MKGDLQSIRFLFILCIGSRQRSKRRFALPDLITFVNKIRDPASVFLTDTQGRRFIISCTVNRIFLSGVMHGQKSRFRNTDRHLRSLQFLMKTRKIFSVTESFPIIQVLHLAILHNTDDITYFSVE